MRKMLIGLAVPLVMVGACSQDEGSDGTLTVLESDATTGVAAEYRVGSDLVRIGTRRIVTEVEGADGSRTTRFVEVDGNGTDFQVELTMVDVQRDIRLTWRGDKPSLESTGASAADKNQAVALFIDAMYALAAAEEPIASREREALAELADGAAGHPGFADPLVPYDESDGCAGFADNPTFSITSVFGTGKLVCLKGGEYKSGVCIRGEEHPLWWNWPEDHGCNETEEKKFDDPGSSGGTITIMMTGDDRADVWCGELGKTYTYQTIIKMVNDEDWFFDDWKEMGKSGLVSRQCGRDH